MRRGEAAEFDVRKPSGRRGEAAELDVPEPSAFFFYCLGALFLCLGACEARPRGALTHKP